ncbi:molecular chaperone DnaK [Ochrobactrum sp. MYb29]|nr:molecular chaperone DnaK [Ochrobactrum sp. MYb29]
MKIGNFAHELADMRAEQEREAGIAAARNQLKQTGTFDCIRCGEEIETERRAAMPSARRCLDCQTGLEQWQATRNPR